MIYTIVRNDRVGYGYKDENLKCTECGCVTTRYIKFINEDVVMDRLVPTIICKGCLWNMIDEMNKDLLEIVYES